MVLSSRKNSIELLQKIAVLQVAYYDAGYVQHIASNLRRTLMRMFASNFAPYCIEIWPQVVLSVLLVSVSTSYFLRFPQITVDLNKTSFRFPNPHSPWPSQGSLVQSSSVKTCSPNLQNKKTVIILLLFAFAAASITIYSSNACVCYQH